MGHPAIPLATTDLSCRRNVKDLACHRYAAAEMTIKNHEITFIDWDWPVSPNAVRSRNRLIQG